MHQHTPVSLTRSAIRATLQFCGAQTAEVGASEAKTNDAAAVFTTAASFDFDVPM